MITDLLDFARPPALDFFSKADPNALIEEVLSDLEVKIKTLNARIEVEKLAELEVVPGQIKQLFQNLILNFIKEKSFTATAKKTGDYYRVSVQDNGIGFDEVYAERIFEIFQRLNQKDAYEGSGIGLSIVKKIIDRHNGLIRASSKKDEGSVFTFILPVQHTRL
jgi:two-component system CheB/CheR fusion protein